MMLVSVSFTFEAESMADAQEIVASWQVTPGVRLLGLQGTESGLAQPVEITMGGTIGVGALKVKPPQSPPPVTPSPGGPSLSSQPKQEGS